MDRTTGQNSKTVGGKRMFTDGPPGTCVDEVFLNGVQEEIMACIEGAGLTPNPNDLTQLSKATQYLSFGSQLSGHSVGAGIVLDMGLQPAGTRIFSQGMVKFTMPSGAATHQAKAYISAGAGDFMHGFPAIPDVPNTTAVNYVSGAPYTLCLWVTAIYELTTAEIVQLYCEGTGTVGITRDEAWITGFILTKG